MKKLIACMMLLISAAQGAGATAEAQMGLLPLVTISKSNTLVLRGVVSGQSVAQIEVQLQAMSAKLKSSDTIYLVLDTPGGSVDAGLELIDFAKALPQRIKTITVFAASMGFHIAENLGERYILPNGTLMSHRVAISGLSGQIPGEALSRMQFIYQTSQDMDRVCARRMKLDTTEYQQLIHDELWLRGEKSVQMQAADKVILAKCDESFAGVSETELGNFLGIKVMGTMSNCPLITGVLAVRMEAPEGATESDKKEANDMGRTYAFDKSTFVRKYVSTGIVK